jgi:hypothetical protein
MLDAGQQLAGNGLLARINVWIARQPTSLVRNAWESLLDSQRTANDRTFSLEAFEIHFFKRKRIVDPSSSGASSIFTTEIVFDNSHTRTPADRELF